MKRIMRRIAASMLSVSMLFNANMPVFITADEPTGETPANTVEGTGEQGKEGEAPANPSQPGELTPEEGEQGQPEEPSAEGSDQQQPEEQPSVTEGNENPEETKPAEGNETDEQTEPSAVPDQLPEESTEPKSSPDSSASPEPSASTESTAEAEAVPEETEEPENEEETAAAYSVSAVYRSEDSTLEEVPLELTEEAVSAESLAKSFDGYVWTGNASVAKSDGSVDDITAVSNSYYVMSGEDGSSINVSFSDVFDPEDTVYIAFDYIKEEVPAEAEKKPVYEYHFTYEDSGIRVTADAEKNAEIPEGAVLHADYLTPGSQKYNDAVSAILNDTNADPEKATEFVLYDIYFTDGDKRIEPNDNVNVKLTFKQPVAPKEENGAIGEADVVHVNNDNEGEVVSEQNVVAGEVGIEEISFTNDSFSPYGVMYTVDYTYDGYTWSMAGESEILLSELFSALGINEDPANVVNAEFTNYELLSLTQAENNWVIKSLKPFDTNEVLTLYMANNDKYIIDVTDDGETPTDLTTIADVSVSIIDGKDEYNRDDSIQFKLNFALKGQWDTSEGNTWVYDLSSLTGEEKVLLSLVNGISGSLDEAGGTEKGTYEIRDNKIILHLVESWISGHYAEVKGFVDFTAQLNKNQNQHKTGDDIPFPGTRGIHINYTERALTTSKTVGASENSQSATQDGSNVQMVKNNDGTYTLYYTITAQPNTDLDSLSVSDTLTGGQTLDAGSVKVFVNGTEKTPEITTTSNSFSITSLPDPVKANDSIRIVYSSTVTESQLNSVQSNQSEWNWEGNTESDTTVVKPVYEQSLGSKKSVGWDVYNYSNYNDGRDMTFTKNADGSYTIYYKIEVNPNTPINTLTVKDTLGSHQVPGGKYKATINISNPSFYRQEEVNSAFPFGSSYDFGSYIKSITNTENIPAGYYSIEYTATVSAADVAENPGLLLTNSAEWTWDLGTKTDNTSVKLKEPEHSVTKTQAVSSGDHQNVQPGDTITYTLKFGTDTQNNPVDMAGLTIKDTI